MRATALAVTMILVMGVTVLADTSVPEKTSSVVAAHPLKIGYVDLTRVLRDYDRRSDFEQGIKSSQVALANGENKLVEKSARYKAEMDQLAMGTPQRIEIEKKHAAVLEELKDFRIKNFDVLNKRFVATVNILYDDVLREIDAFGRENDYDFIIKDQSVEAPATTHDAVVLQITKRVVLYSKPEYDLSSVIAQRLNEKYRAEQAKESGTTGTKTPAKPVEKR